MTENCSDLIHRYVWSWARRINENKMRLKDWKRRLNKVQTQRDRPNHTSSGYMKELNVQNVSHFTEFSSCRRITTLETQESSCCRELAITGWWDEIFSCVQNLFQKMLFSACISQNVSIIQKLNRNRPISASYRSSLVTFYTRKGVLHTLFISCWSTGHCWEVILAVGTRFSGCCHYGEWMDCLPGPNIFKS